ncbi:putative HTH-type transcriptional regulator y4mF [Pseudomonas reidholzensis]|uniref:Putative HTH-type transcriptional regulator y4mF n=1 Tax=Pseudomonas reidholzensis TaxID=1785162 RepID=A0A383RWP0_9PSED|nr:helix-turn-helix domain-containing protein [Pseudomonas reidholzensis]SYX91442.1 putative HTH-type transcriptional regulator y4mF [Pseudomonas reidholzensis]
MNTLLKIRNADDVGAAVRQVRKSQQITQADLALIVGKSHVLMRDIEKGKGTVSLATVLQVLQELGIQLYMDLPEK